MGVAPPRLCVRVGGEAGPRLDGGAPEGGGEPFDFDRLESAAPGLHDHLLAQAGHALAGPDLAVAAHLIAHLNKAGYLTEPLSLATAADPKTGELRTDSAARGTTRADPVHLGRPVSDERTTLDDSSARLRKTMTRQFATMDSRVAGFRSTQSFLEGQIKAWSSR